MRIINPTSCIYLALGLYVLGCLTPVSSFAADTCTFSDSNGVFRIVTGRESVPLEYREGAKCKKQIKKRSIKQSSAKSNSLSKDTITALKSLMLDVIHEKTARELKTPESVQLKGDVVEETIETQLGSMSLRWSKTSEVHFRKPPATTIKDASILVSQALLFDSFPQRLSNFKIYWPIVFLNEEILKGQVPKKLINNCHPGWMTPPSNIYLVTERIGDGCFTKETTRYSAKADQALFEVTIHEMAHSIEYALLQKEFFFDRARAEGFATWFQVYALSKSVRSKLEAKVMRNTLNKLAATALKSLSRKETVNIKGTSLEYALYSMPFFAIEDRYGTPKILSVYDRIASNKISFVEAIKQEIGWDYPTLLLKMFLASKSMIRLPSESIEAELKTKAKKSITFDEALCRTLRCISRHKDLTARRKKSIQ